MPRVEGLLELFVSYFFPVTDLKDSKMNVANPPEALEFA
ncbi:hypothetical protein VIB_002834 [Vibrio metschnikovii CIP 69.14]|nr:hypothetical protein VIB_002834 [Vibrio metschnikovii CIP 69.14]